MYNVGDCLHGFTYEGNYPAPNVEGTAHLFRHEETNALVMYIETERKKFCFNMGFRTPAHDDTGVTHIIEHSVLEGSKKYAHCESFDHIMNVTIADELNAYTNYDHTNYHFSTRNEKDFEILFDFYMDAIIHPTFLTDPSIFLRQGWHLENIKGGKAEVKGVVFNEMKSRMLDKLWIEYGTVLGLIFPGTCYQYEAGGDICSIPLLNYDDAIKYYKKYYHPSNSAMCLYGKLDIEKYLKILNDEFFTGYGYRKYTFKNLEVKGEVKKLLHLIKPVTKPIALGEELNDVWLTYNGGKLNRLEQITISMLLYYTMHFNEHKVRYHLLKYKLCEDVDMFQGNCAPGSYYGLFFSDVPDKATGDVVNVFIKLLERIRDEGIDYKSMKLILKMFRRSYTKDYVDEFYVDEALETAIRGGNPFEMSFKECFDFIEDKLMNDIGWFSECYDKYLIHSDNYNVSIFAPDPDYKNKLIAELDSVVNSQKWTKEERQSILKTTKAVYESAFASEEPSVKHLELTKDDIDNRVEINNYREYSVLGKKCRGYIIPNSDLVYLRMEFDISNLSVRETTLFTAIAESFFYNYTRDKSNIENFYRGVEILEDWETKVVFVNDTKNDKLRRKFRINLEFKKGNMDQVVSFLSNMLINTTYGHMVTTYSYVYWSMLDAIGLASERPNNVATMMVNSYYSKAANLRNKAKGPKSFEILYSFLEDASKPSGMKALARKCQNVFWKVINRERMKMYFAADNFETLHELEEKLGASLKGLRHVPRSSDMEYVPVSRAFAPLSEAASIETLVQYNCLSIDVREEVKNLDISMDLVCMYLQEWIVHKFIRDVGTAYGGQIRYEDGVFTYNSWCDPEFEKTMDVFVNSSNYFKNFEVNDLERHQIALAGRMNLFDKEIDKVEAIEMCIRDGKNPSTLEKEADKVFNTTAEDIYKVCDIITKAAKAKKYSYYSIGNLDKFKESREGILDRVIVY